VFGLIVVHYLTALAVETPLSLRFINKRKLSTVGSQFASAK